jgi:enolase
LDGSANKSKLGANAICSVSMAVAKAGAGRGRVWRHIADLAQNPTPSLPKPCFNIINGGAHAGNELDVQEFMIVPQGDKFSDNLRAAAEVYHRLKKVLSGKFGKPATNLGDEGGFAPDLKTPEEALALIMEAVGTDKIKIIMDVASTQFFDNGGYKMHIGNFSPEQLGELYKKLAAQFPIIGFEDPFAEDDWEAWTLFKPEGAIVIGDDLLVTNPMRIKEAQEKKACNAMILKLNQIGTVSEGLEAARLAKSYGWKIVVSHRSGETNDDFIADFAVGIGAEFIKSGAPARGERLAKYNRLAKIEEELKL